MIKKLLKEFLGTFVLVLMGTTVISLTGGNMFATALAFGFGLVAAATIFGGHFNPARSIAPALLQGGDSLKHLCIFIIAPLLGGSFAGLVSKYLE